MGTHYHLWWRHGWRQSPGWHPLLSGHTCGWRQLWQASGWRRHAQRCLCPQPPGTLGRLALRSRAARRLSLPLPHLEHPTLTKLFLVPDWASQASKEARKGLQKLELGWERPRVRKGLRSIRGHQRTTDPEAQQESRQAWGHGEREEAPPGRAGAEGGWSQGCLSTLPHLPPTHVANDVPVGGPWFPGHSNGRSGETYCLPAPGGRGWLWVPCHSQAGAGLVGAHAVLCHTLVDGLVLDRDPCQHQCASERHSCWGLLPSKPPALLQAPAYLRDPQTCPGTGHTPGCGHNLERSRWGRGLL